LKFLRHVERCAALLFLVDLSSPDCPGTVRLLEAELETYSRSLASRPRLVIGTKLDLPESTEGHAALSDAFQNGGFVAVSSFSREGLSSLVAAIRTLVGAAAAANAGAPPG
jgi:GTP-binding protein